LFNLRGKVIFIIGGDQNIGAEFAKGSYCWHHEPRESRRYYFISLGKRR